MWNLAGLLIQKLGIVLPWPLTMIIVHLTSVDLTFSCTKGYPGQVKRNSLPFQVEAALKYLVVPLTFAHDCTVHVSKDLLFLLWQLTSPKAFFFGSLPLRKLPSLAAYLSERMASASRGPKPSSYSVVDDCQPDTILRETAVLLRTTGWVETCQLGFLGRQLCPSVDIVRHVS